MSVSGVGGGEKTLNLGRGRNGIENKRGTRTRRTIGKKETTLKRQDSESESSGVYHQDEISATPVQSIAHNFGAFHPSAKVNISLYQPFLPS